MPATPDRTFTDRYIFLHGFTQTHHHWHAGAHALRSRLGREPSTALVDLPGHGLSRNDVHNISEGGAVVAALGGAGTYIGYSMGGRFALFAALARPDLVERLVLIGATAGIENADERAARAALDDERATRVSQIGVERFLDEWLAAPMFAGLPPDPDGRRHRERNTVAGLAHSLRACGTGRQASLWSDIDRLAMPVLVLAGERDEKFSGLGRELAAKMLGATFRTVPGAGHAAHVEACDATVEIVVSWLSD